MRSARKRVVSTTLWDAGIWVSIGVIGGWLFILMVEAFGR
jgi:hypothetical protein